METNEFKEPKVIDRIVRLKAALFYRPREISLERALLYTESHRQTEGEHVQLRRAKAAAHVLRKVAISIRDDELIAGNRTIKPRAGIVPAPFERLARAVAASLAEALDEHRGVHRAGD